MKLTVACAGMGSLPLATGGYAFFLPTGQSFSEPVTEKFRKCFSCFEACHIRCERLRHHNGVLVRVSLQTQQLRSAGRFRQGKRGLSPWALCRCGYSEPLAVPMHLSPSPPPPPREDNPGPKQIVSPLMYQGGRCEERGPAQDVESERPGREPWSTKCFASWVTSAKTLGVSGSWL